MIHPRDVVRLDQAGRAITIADGLLSLVGGEETIDARATEVTGRLKNYAIV
jgi:hypothetical protein